MVCARTHLDLPSLMAVVVDVTVTRFFDCFCFPQLESRATKGDRVVASGSDITVEAAGRPARRDAVATESKPEHGGETNGASLRNIE